MPRDELRRPLRRRSLKDRLWERRPGPFASAAAGLAAVFIIGGIWAARIPMPFAGEPVIVAEIPNTIEIVTSSTTPAEEQPAPEDTAPADEASGQGYDPQATDIQVMDQDEQAAPDPRVYRQEAAIYVAPHRPLKKAPVEAVTEKSADGPLPRISDRGKKPFDVYSQVTPLAVTTSARPRITLVLGGMGLNPKLTRKAVDMLPGDVTLGFAPYGEDLQAQVNRARAQGHEVLLQVPMEPVGYPGSNPGPNTILSDAPPEKNIVSLKWLMSRFAGYSGITNYMGARLLVTEDALRPVMKEVKARGLVYLEDATVNLTLSPRIGQEVQLPMQRADMVIDAEPTAAAIAEKLEKLEKQAMTKGSAIGTGSGLDVTIETVAEWAKTLQEKGILLVPVSAAYKGRPS